MRDLGYPRKGFSAAVGAEVLPAGRRKGLAGPPHRRRQPELALRVRNKCSDGLRGGEELSNGVSPGKELDAIKWTFFSAPSGLRGGGR